MKRFLTYLLCLVGVGSSSRLHLVADLPTAHLLHEVGKELEERVVVEIEPDRVAGKSPPLLITRLHGADVELWRVLAEAWDGIGNKRVPLMQDS